MKGEKIIMTNTKITKRDYFTGMMALLNGEDADITVADAIEFCEKEIAALASRAEKAKERAAAKREAGDELQSAVLEVLTDEFATRAEIADRIEGIEGVTVAKVGYRLTQLVKNGQAVKDETTVTGEDGKSRKATVYKLA